MTALPEEDLDHKFRKLVIRISKELTSENCQSLKFLYKTKTPVQSDLSGLAILDELMSQGLFSYQQPDKLIELLSSIEQQNLARLVTEYQKELAQRQGTKKNGKWYFKSSSSPESDKSTRSSNMLPVTLMTVLNINCHTFSLLEEAEKEAALLSKKEVTVIAEVKKDFKKLKDSLKKAVATITEAHVMELRHTFTNEESDALSLRRNAPLPSIPTKPHISTSRTLPNLSSIDSTESTEKRSSVPSMPGKSNDEMVHTEQKGSRMFPEMSTSPLSKPRSHAISLEKAPDLAFSGSNNNHDDDDDNDDYMNPLTPQDYAALTANTLEQTHEYSELQT